MTNLRKTLAGALCLSASMLLAGHAGAETLVRWTEGTADNGVRTGMYHWFADTVTERTGGDVKFQFYFGGALMGLAANVAGIGSGTADVGAVIAGYNPKELQAYTVGDLPLIGVDLWVGMKAMHELVTTDPTLKAMFDDLNLRYITGHTTGQVQFICNGMDLKSLDDFKGAKIRTAGATGEVMRELGANTVWMSQVDAYSALDTGVVSCNQQYIQGVIEHRQFEVTDQLILTNLGQILGFGVVMNRDTFDALPQDDQDTLLQAGDEFIDLFAEKLMKSTEEDLVKLQDASSEYHMKVTELSEADNEKLREAAEVYNANWVEQANAAGLPGNELLDTFRGLIEKYDATLKEKGYPWEAR